VLGGVTTLEGEGVILWENVSDKHNTPNYCELNWVMQRHTTGTDAGLQTLDESIIGREVRAGIAHRGRSLISTIALLKNVIRVPCPKTLR